MIEPIKYKGREPLNSLIGIKSSLSNLRSVVALTYLLYLANEKKESIAYSKDDGLNGIIIKDEYKEFIKTYLHDDDLYDTIANNPLFKSQIESLYVGITLMFGLGKISFEDKKMSMTKERTGGNRYTKEIQFSSNIIALDLILQSVENSQLIEFLVGWLKDTHLSNDIELRVSTFLNLCIENNLFKLRKGDEDIIFQSEGIYLGLNDDSIVSLDSDEKVGPARILNSMLSEGLIPWLNVNSSKVSYNTSCPFNYKAYSKIVSTSLDIRDIKADSGVESPKSIVTPKNIESIIEGNTQTISALRTKPFLLLAGISGTGKSRIVRELAFKSCPEKLQDKDGTTPGNYCMIEVKPNWHDSSELLGYYSNISKKYVYTKFVKFLVKAMRFPNVPFFVCLDEMNLAPVEQYFAEFLSVLETRKMAGNKVVTSPLVDKSFFSEIYEIEGETKKILKENPTDKEWYEYFFGIKKEEGTKSTATSEDSPGYGQRSLKEKGLCLPENVFVIGTVNMDDTTHQFSRKVIDRAMTIEMNGGKLEDMFGGSKNLEYLNDSEIFTMDHIGAKYVSADDALEYCERMNNDEVRKFVTGKDDDGNIITDGETLPKMLYKINDILKNTPFQVSYRVLNELVIYLAVLLDEDKESTPIEDLAKTALDNIMLMKILPRIEGDSEMFNQSGEDNKLVELQKMFAPEYKSYKKLDEMIKRLESTEFTRFWP